MWAMDGSQVTTFTTPTNTWLYIAYDYNCVTNHAKVYVCTPGGTAALVLDYYYAPGLFRGAEAASIMVSGEPNPDEPLTGSIMKVTYATGASWTLGGVQAEAGSATVVDATGLAALFFDTSQTTLAGALLNHASGGTMSLVPVDTTNNPTLVAGPTFSGSGTTMTPTCWITIVQ
jgi:hypothetical protein